MGPERNGGSFLAFTMKKRRVWEQFINLFPFVRMSSRACERSDEVGLAL